MGRWSEPPFARGETYFNGDIIDTSDLTQLGGEILEGRHYVFEDSIHLTGAEVTVKVVRNMSATPVMPGQLLLPTTVGSYTGISWPTGTTGLPDEPLTWAPGDYIGRVNGLSGTAGPAELVYIADEILPGNGVPQYDLFYVVVDGPVAVDMVWPNPVVTVGEHIVSAVTTSATQGAGQATIQSLAGATTTLGNQIQHSIGVSLEAVAVATTTSATQYSAGYLTTIPLLINAKNKW